MKREEIIEVDAIAQKCVVKVERRPLYFEQSRARGSEGPIFGWYHSTPAALQSDCSARRSCPARPAVAPWPESVRSRPR